MTHFHDPSNLTLGILEEEKEALELKNGTNEMLIASLESSTIFYRDKSMEQCTQIAVQRDQLLQSKTLSYII